MVKYAVICASNQNRSMEAHNVLRKEGYDISSYGTGNQVRLPGPTKDAPNVYSFGTPYDKIYRELEAKDKTLYTRNGLLPMLDRNRNIKEAPERWQERGRIFDVIITCEERCYDAVLEDLAIRGEHYNTSTHVINVNIEDDHENARLGGQAILELTRKIEAADDIDAQMDEIIRLISKDNPRFPILHTVAFF